MLFVVFAWLMNEAFNLYISLTYAAHQSSPVSDSGGSQFRLYLLGWILPAVMVIILLATKSKYYYDKKLCWFNLDSLWVNVSPMISMLAVSLPIKLKSHPFSTHFSTFLFYHQDYDTSDDILGQGANGELIHQERKSQQANSVRVRSTFSSRMNEKLTVSFLSKIKQPHQGCLVTNRLADSLLDVCDHVAYHSRCRY